MADAHGSATTKPSQTMRPAATRPEEPSVAAKRERHDFAGGGTTGLLSFSELCHVQHHRNVFHQTRPKNRR